MQFRSSKMTVKNYSMLQFHSIKPDKHCSPFKLQETFEIDWNVVEHNFSIMYEVLL